MKYFGNTTVLYLLIKQKLLIKQIRNEKKSFCTCFNFMSWFTITLSQVNFNLLFATENNVSHYLAGSKR